MAWKARAALSGWLHTGSVKFAGVRARPMLRAPRPSALSPWQSTQFSR
jgi:hypothetical protein